MISKEVEANILRLFHVEKWPPGTIGRHLGVHHETVRRVLRSAGIEERVFLRRPSLADPYLPFIVESLEKYPKLCASRLYQMVRERGYRGRPDHFRAIVARHRPRPTAEAYLRLRTLPGEQAQVDWAHFGHVEIDGARRPLVAFLMVLSWSRYRFLRFGFDLRTGAFLDHHQAAFEFLGGVPRTLLYDNLKSAVLERRGDAIRFNENLLAFAAHYRYEPRPCAPYRGNEKGRVERMVRDVRDSFFAARNWNGLEDLNRQALAWCTGLVAERRWPDDKTRTVQDCFEEEKLRLFPLPQDRFPVEDRQEVHIGKTPYARFDGNDYSVPHDRVRRTLVVCASPDLVRILDGMEVVASHARAWGRGLQIEDPAHLRELVAWKAKARVERGQDRLIHAAPSSQALLVAIAQRGGPIGSAVAALLRLLDSHGTAALEEALLEALAKVNPSVADVRLVLQRKRHEAGLPEPVPVPLPDDPRVRNLVVRPHALRSYDLLDPEDDHD
jgi:transposase